MTPKRSPAVSTDNNIVDFPASAPASGKAVVSEIVKTTLSASEILGFTPRKNGDQAVIPQQEPKKFEELPLDERERRLARQAVEKEQLQSRWSLRHFLGQSSDAEIQPPAAMAL